MLQYIYIRFIIFSCVVGFNLEINLQADARELFNLATDFERTKDLFPAQLQNIEIISKNNNEIITEEELTFRTLLKDTIIKQKTVHKIQFPIVVSNIIEGPFKKSVITATFNKINSGTNLIFNVQFNIPLKYKILIPIIKSKYKSILLSLAYKMNNMIMK